jgi:SAM-dependent methyltransferase
MSLPAAYFDRMYAAAADPWAFEERWYERRKYALTVAVLPRARYRRAFEPGCSIGVLTAALAPRCEQLLSVDISPLAVQRARARLAGYAGVEVRQSALPEWPIGTFDLIVLSEVAYYFDDGDLTTVIDAAVTSLEPGGDLVAVHWRHPVAEYPQSGDAVHRAIRAHPGLATVSRLEELDFLLEVFRRVPPPAESVAQREKII